MCVCVLLRNNTRSPKKEASLQPMYQRPIDGKHASRTPCIWGRRINEVPCGWRLTRQKGILGVLAGNRIRREARVVRLIPSLTRASKEEVEGAGALLFEGGEFEGFIQNKKHKAPSHTFNTVMLIQKEDTPSKPSRS